MLILLTHWIKFLFAFLQAGIASSPSMQFSVLAEGVASGYSTVAVRVTAEDPMQKQLTSLEFNAEIALNVSDALLSAFFMAWQLRRFSTRMIFMLL